MATTPTSIEVILQVNVAGVPLKVRGLTEGGKLLGFSGRATIQKSLGQLLDGLGAQFSGPSGVLKQVTASSDIKLDSLEFEYNAAEPKFAQVAATLTAGASDCRFICLKPIGKDGFIAGLEVGLDKRLFSNNPLSGLVGEISVDDLGLYYATEAFGNVNYDPNRVLPEADQLILPDASGISGRKSRDFTKGMNWSGRISVAGSSLLDWSGVKGGAKSLPAAQPAGPPVNQPKSATEPPQLGGSTFWIELDKTLGPVSVRRVGLGYEAPRVAIKFDASLSLSVLTASLEGFGLSYPLDKFADLLDSPLKFFDHVRFLLDGAAVTFSQGPFTIAGGLIKVQKPYLQLDGTLLIRVPGLTITAIGSYADLNGTPSFFAFAALLMELGDPTTTGFFFVVGLAVGFGVNRTLKLPTINAVHEFPLIKAATDEKYLGDKLDLRGVSQKLNDYIAPSAGDFWIAAGVRFTSYGQIDSFVLLSVAFGTRLEIALLGISKIQIPKPPAPVLASAELAIRVVISPDSGLLSVEARLTENSYLLQREFKLRGGFAFYTWFGGEHAGDFVVSLGGYHPRFLPPAHYPKPDLVQFYAKAGDVTLQGSCYFAFCPSAIMAGISLSLVYQSSGVRAWFVAYAHFLVQWKPLHYEVEIAISVGIAISLDVGVARALLSLEVGAALSLYGPPLGGEARISLAVITVTVAFGEPRSVPPALLWESQDPEKSFAKSFLMNPDVTRVVIVDGLLEEIKGAEKSPASKDGKPLAQFVNPHRLKLSYRTQMPATDTLYNGHDATKIPGVKVNGDLPQGAPSWNRTFGVRPMQKRQCYSLLDFTLAPKVTASAERKQQMMDYMNQYVDISLITGKVPRALWANDALDPHVPAENQMVDNALLGLELKTKEGPRPSQTPAFSLEVLSYDRFPKTCAFARVDPADSLPDYGNKTISSTIGDAAVSRKRLEILRVLRNSGCRIMDPEDIHLQHLRDQAPYIFQATPLMAWVGQYPPRGYQET